MLTQSCQHCVNCIGTWPHLCAIAVMHIKVEDHNLHMSLHSIMLYVTCYAKQQSTGLTLQSVAASLNIWMAAAACTN